MRKSALIVSAIALALVGAGSLFARQDGGQMPEAPKPTAEHQWLQQFVGEWTMHGKMDMGPGTDPLECDSTESVRAIGDIWILSELRGQMPGGGPPMSAIMTLGYDPEKGHFVGTWADSFNPYLWVYKGSLDASGKILTLEAEGPNMMAPGTMAMFRDVTEFKSKDERVLTSSMKGADGKWVTFMTATFTRKK